MHDMQQQTPENTVELTALESGLDGVVVMCILLFQEIARMDSTGTRRVSTLTEIDICVL